MSAAAEREAWESATMIPINRIQVGARFRKDLGDVAALAESIALVGLLHPVVVTPDFRLIAGARRLAAVQRLGWDNVPATVVDLAEIVKGEYAENAVRKSFLPSEIDAIRRALAPGVAVPNGRPRKDRQQPETMESCHSSRPAPPTRDKVATFAGVSGRTVEKIAAVVEAAEQDPETFAPLVAEMDKHGRVDGVYRRMLAKTDEKRLLSVEPAAGRFRTLVVDPPWDYMGYNHLSVAGRSDALYGVMSQAQLLELQVPDWAEDECHLYLWSTNNFIPHAVELVAAWGFAYKTLLTWVKPRIGMGSYFRGSTEQVLFAVRGGITTRVNDIPTHFEAPVGEHSEKPDCFYDLVRRASYPPFGEVFQRERRPDFAPAFIEKTHVDSQ